MIPLVSRCCKFAASHFYRRIRRHSHIHRIRPTVRCLLSWDGVPMRYLSIAIVAAASAVAFTQITWAADMPVKAPVYKAPVYKAPVAAFSWTGFYVGASAGYGWSDADLSLASVGTAVPPFPAQFLDAGASATPPI